MTLTGASGVTVRKALARKSATDVSDCTSRPKRKKSGRGISGKGADDE